MLPSVVTIKEEEGVLILQEQLPELLRLNLAGAGADWTRGVIDYLVRRTENPDSSRALLTLSETKWGHLMQLFLSKNFSNFIVQQTKKSILNKLCYRL